MSRRNSIIITADPKGQFDEGQVAVSNTLYPGMIVQRDYTVALKGGRFTYKVYTRDANGDHPKGGYWVVTERMGAMLGKTMTDSYAAGDRIMVYSPRNGEELNLLMGDVAGTADSHAIGEILMAKSAAGTLIATTGNPEDECAVLQETLTALTANALAWCVWNA